MLLVKINRIRSQSLDSRICPSVQKVTASLDSVLAGVCSYKAMLYQDPMEKVRQISRSTALETSIKKESHRIPFVITFNPALKIIPQVISSNLNILLSSHRCLEAFSSLPRISCRRCKSLRDILVRAKHRRQAPPASGAFRCHRNRCKTCPFILEGIHLTLFSLPTNQDAYAYPKKFMQGKMTKKNHAKKKLKEKKLCRRKFQL